MNLILTNLYPFMTIKYLKELFLNINNNQIIQDFNEETVKLNTSNKEENTKIINLLKELNYQMVIDENRIDFLYKTDKLNTIPYLFLEDYTSYISTKYEKNNKDEGLVFTDKVQLDKQREVLSYLIKKISKTLFKSGESIMNVSLPVEIFDSRTLLQVFAYELGYSEVYLNKAFYSFNNIERLKWVTVFFISQFHLGLLQTKPFNPILGETLQIRLGNLEIYMEHVIHKPPTYLFYCISKNYTISGYQIIEAKTGINSVKAYKKGEFRIRFNDGVTYSFHYPTLHIKGVNLGKRLFSLNKNAVLFENTSNLCSFININPEKGFFQSKTNPPDYIEGYILDKKYIKICNKVKFSLIKGYIPISNIKGEWSNYISFDNQEYWTYNEVPMCKFFKSKSLLLQSDSDLRLDVENLKLEKNELSLKYKEEYERIQREDRDLREQEFKVRNKKK